MAQVVRDRGVLEETGTRMDEEDEVAGWKWKEGDVRSNRDVWNLDGTVRCVNAAFECCCANVAI